MDFDHVEIITVEELAEMLYINRNAAYDLCRSGSIKAFKIGRVWKIPRIALTDYILEKMTSRKG